jgi:hypothetical protein
MKDLEVIGIIFGGLYGLPDGGTPTRVGDALGLAFVQCNTINQGELGRFPTFVISRNCGIVPSLWSRRIRRIGRRIRCTWWKKFQRTCMSELRCLLQR